ncbi:MAG: hypothetical protein CME10_04850, partial [Gemmatimonadetes bacterium]|nr:hypothetical protein [Gemmatimonadota bacterium]
MGFTSLIVRSIKTPLIGQLILSILSAATLSSLLPEKEGINGWSLFPPLVAISVAILTKRLVLGLSLAIFSGAFLSQPDHVTSSMLLQKTISTALVDFVWKPLSDSFQIYILGFTASLIGMVRVISLAGGTRGIADLLIKGAAGARSTRITT